MHVWLQDLRYSARSLLRRPGFTAVTVATLALGIGASTAIFSAVYAVLFRPLPYEQAEGMVVVFHENLRTGERGQGLSAANAHDLMELADTLTDVAVGDPYSLDLQVDGRTEALRTWAVSPGFFGAARVQPHLGRTFTPDEYQQGGEPVAMIGYRSWLSRFGSDPGIVGEVLTFDAGPVTVVGVLPPEFKLPDEKELWIPRPVQPRDDSGRAADYMLGIARLAPGATLEQAQAEAERIAASLREAHPGTMADTTFRLVSLREHLFGDVRTPLLVLMGAVGFVLLIACANVAGLMLARGSERQREYALRSALGAGTGRLVRQVTVDGSVLAVLGCAVGIGLAYGGVSLIRGIGPESMPRIEEIAVDRTALLFAVAVTGLSAFLSGLAPALRLSRPDLRESLDHGGRGTTGGGSTLRNGMVVAEVAAAMVLLVGAGLLTRSFDVLMDRDLGFDPHDRLVMQLFAYGYGQDGDMSREQFVTRAIEEIEAIPGVRRVALTSNVPAATDGTVASIDIDLPFTIDGRPPATQGQEPQAHVSIISDGYLDVMGMAVVAGRGFAATDDAQGPAVVLVNEAFARRHLPDADPTRESVTLAFSGPPASRDIVGVVGDVLPSGHESEARPEIYFPFGQTGSLGVAGNLTFVVRADGEAAQLTSAVKEAVWRVNPAQAVWGATTLEDLLADWMKQRSFNLLLLGSFALIALALAGVGIYGLISFSVQQRIGEMGIRRALGGQAGSILGMVVRDAQMLAGAGVVLGVIGALLLARFIRGMLYGVEATDPLTFALLALTVLGVSALAAVVPGLRAMRVDPVVALRNDFPAT